MNASGGVKSAIRALDMLEFLSGLSDGIGVSDIARALGMPKSSAYMLLLTLETRGYVISKSDRRFVLSPLFGDGCSWVGGPHVALARLARPAMHGLVEATGESSFLGVVRTRQTMEYVAKVLSAHELRCDAELHQARTLHSTSVGIALLAFQDPNATAQYLAGKTLKRVTPHTICDTRELKREIAAIRERGYSIARDTNAPGASGIAAPIFMPGGRLIGALNISAPTSRFEPVLQRGAAHLLRATRLLSEQLSNVWSGKAHGGRVP